MFVLFVVSAIENYKSIISIDPQKQDLRYTGLAWQTLINQNSELFKEPDTTWINNWKKGTSIMVLNKEQFDAFRMEIATFGNIPILSKYCGIGCVFCKVHTDSYFSGNILRYQ